MLPSCLLARAPFFCLLATCGLSLAARPAHAQNRVANYSCGQPGTAAYEHFSFWTNDQQRTDIQYAYGKNRTDVRPRYAGPGRLQGQPCFKVQFARRTLYLRPSGTTLLVAASATAPPKTFTWEYEGPVNGVGTVCSMCAPSAAAAMRLVQRHYLR
ncbi:MAG: hypothetical protein EOO56_00620 [Hymenobacter sp.]|nr:MAG: hypothetical protein EOO56_00620 [Hymenobacter sp.]